VNESIKYLGFVFLIAACTSRTAHIDGKFKESGPWYYRTFQFKKDGTFDFNNQLGFHKERTITGTYVISDNIIFLNPDTDFLDQELKLKLRVIDSGCLRDYDNVFYSSDSLAGEKLTQAEYKFQEETTSILDTLREVQKEREYLDIVNQKYLNRYPNIIVSDVSVDYQGIVVVDKRELHLFEYVKVDTTYHNQTEHFLRLLVHKEPFEIYRLYNFEDSLRLIYKEGK
jgi:hypothetical protein